MKPSQKRPRVGGGLVSDPNTVEARDQYFVSFEKGLAGNSGKTPEAPISLAAALDKCVSLDASVTDIYGSKLYVLPTTTSQDVGASKSIDVNNLSIEGVSVANGVLSNPSLYQDTAGESIFNFVSYTGNQVEIKGISFNAYANSVKMLLVNLGSSITKLSVSDCRFYNKQAGLASGTIGTSVTGIHAEGELVLFNISGNALIGCSAYSIYSTNAHMGIIEDNKILGSGITGQSVTTGIDVTGCDVAIMSNLVMAGSIGGVQGTTGIACSDESCAVVSNAIGGWTTPTSGTALVGNTITVA